MAITPFTKYADETLSFGVDFSGSLPAGARISSGTVAAYDSGDVDVSGSVLSSTTLVIDGTTATFATEAGATAATYRVVLTLTLSNAETQIDVASLVVQDPLA